MGVRCVKRLLTCVDNLQNGAVQSDPDVVYGNAMFCLLRRVSLDGIATIALEHTCRRVSSLNGKTRQGAGGPTERPEKMRYDALCADGNGVLRRDCDHQPTIATATRSALTCLSPMRTSRVYARSLTARPHVTALGDLKYSLEVSPSSELPP